MTAAAPDRDEALRWSVPHGPTDLEVQMLAPLLLRTPGFPAALLGPLADTGLLSLAQQAHTLAAQEEEARRQFMEELWPVLRSAARDGGRRHPSWPALLRAHRRVEQGRPVDGVPAQAVASLGDERGVRWTMEWNALLSEEEKLGAEATEALRAATLRAYRHTACAVDDERMRHAMFVSNPSFFHTALARPLSARLTGAHTDAPDRSTRRTLATAHRYLRRFTTKCETVSFFGPVLYAHVDRAQPEPVRLCEPVHERVVVEASTWLTELLARHDTAHTPAPGRRARRSPLFAEPADGSRVLVRAIDGKHFRVSAAALRLWRAADGEDDLGALAERLDVSVTEVVETLRELGPALLVSGAEPLAATELAALARLAGRDPDGPAGDIARARDAYADAPWPERTTFLDAVWERVRDLGGETRRGAGDHYADREVFFEDRASPYNERVTFGGPTLDGLRRALTAVLPLCHLAALLRREDARDALRAELGGSDAPLLHLAGRRLAAAQPRTDRLREVLRRLVATAEPDGEGAVRLTRERLDAETAALWDLVPPDDRYDAALPSPDLMAVGTDPGQATWLLSELHDDCSSIFGGLESRMHSAPADLWDDFAEIAGEYVDPAGMATIVSRRRSAHVTPELPGVSVELSGLSGKPRRQTAPIAQTSVCATGDALLVRGERRRLYPGDLDSPLHRAVALPAVVPLTIETGAHTPRIVVDGVVYQRARWRAALPPQPTRDPYDRWLAVQRWRIELGLPRRVFVRHPNEPKPLYVDFADPLAVADLARLAEAECVVSEMLPAPDRLWWQADGGRQCAEFRLGCVVRAVRRGTEGNSDE
ncbi:hypothetical protein [Streptomyces sp. NPDC000877]|uniref:hypothetical protein n=1 Tax=unclassified Streptomyces TaxID=2593676 RepID=UPI003316D0E2